MCSKMFQMHNAFSGGKENKPNKAHVFDFSNQFADLHNNFSYTKKKIGCRDKMMGDTPRFETPDMTTTVYSPGV